MRNLFRGSAILVVGIILGSLLTGRTAAQQPRDAGVRLTGVGLSVKDVDAEFDYYTKAFGFREAFTQRDAEGKSTMRFLQVSQDTFLQLVPSNANRPVGLSSVLFEVADVQAIQAKLKQSGAKVGDVRPAEGTATKQPLAVLTDPEGFRVELLQLTPGSALRTAKESWKP